MSINKDFEFKHGQVFRFDDIVSRGSRSHIEYHLLVRHEDAGSFVYRTVGIEPPQGGYTLSGVEDIDGWFRERMTYVGLFHELYQRTFKDDQ